MPGEPTHKELTGKKLEQRWQETSESMNALYGPEENRTQETIAQSIQEFLQRTLTSEHFAKEGRTHIVCIDEGCACSHSVEDLIALAGSGIVMGDNYDTSLETATQTVKDMGIEVVTSHAGCGAGNLAFKELPEEAQQHYTDLFNKLTKEEGKGTQYLSPSDLYAADFAQGLATEAGLDYRHISAKEMTRPEDMHTARMIVVDATGRLQPQRIDNLPPAFLISEKYLSPEYAQAELSVALSIALGDHGFGKHFKDNEPLVVIVLGAPSSESFNDTIESVKQLVDTEFADKPVQVVEYQVDPDVFSDKH